MRAFKNYFKKFHSDPPLLLKRIALICTEANLDYIKS